jgi:hypothetical protein
VLRTVQPRHHICGALVHLDVSLAMQPSAVAAEQKLTQSPVASYLTLFGRLIYCTGTARALRGGGRGGGSGSGARAKHAQALTERGCAPTFLGYSQDAPNLHRSAHPNVRCREFRGYAMIPEIAALISSSMTPISDRTWTTLWRAALSSCTDWCKNSEREIYRRQR